MKISPARTALLAAILPLGGCTMGLPEIALILAIVVLLFGASRLPQLGSALGEMLRSFRKATTEDDQQDKLPPPNKKIEGTSDDENKGS